MGCALPFAPAAVTALDVIARWWPVYTLLAFVATFAVAAAWYWAFEMVWYRLLGRRWHSKKGFRIAFVALLVAFVGGYALLMTWTRWLGPNR